MSREPHKSLTRIEGEILATLLREYRVNAGVSQRDLAKRMGLPQPRISELESGRRRLDVLELIDFATIVGIEPAELVTELRKRSPTSGR